MSFVYAYSNAPWGVDADEQMKSNCPPLMVVELLFAGTVVQELEHHGGDASAYLKTLLNDLKKAADFTTGVGCRGAVLRRRWRAACGATWRACPHPYLWASPPAQAGLFSFARPSRANLLPRVCQLAHGFLGWEEGEGGSAAPCALPHPLPVPRQGSEAHRDAVLGGAAPGDAAAGSATSAAQPAARVCAWAGCGKQLPADPAEQSRCGRCKRAFYCNRSCQKKHWKEGHKHACEEPPCCAICLDGGDDPLPMQRGCACRGDAGLVHVACLAEAAARKARGHHAGWYQCSTCDQEFTGAVALALAREEVHRMRTRRRDDTDRLAAKDSLGNALSSAGLYAEAGKAFEEVLAVIERTRGKGDEQTIPTISNLAVSYCHEGKYEKAIKLLAPAHVTTTKLLGKEHPSTLTIARNLANAYSSTGHYAEAEKLQVEGQSTRGNINRHRVVFLISSTRLHVRCTRI